MPKLPYRSAFDGKSQFYRNVFIDRKFDGLWTFVEGEDADKVVRGYLERRFGPQKAAMMSVVVSMPDNIAMAAAYPALAVR